MSETPGTEAGPVTLDEAWARAEAALPKAGWLDPIDGRWVVPNGLWTIAIRHLESGDGYFEPAVDGFEATAKLDAHPRPFAIRGDVGPDPADALASLARVLLDHARADTPSRTDRETLEGGA